MGYRTVALQETSHTAKELGVLNSNVRYCTEYDERVQIFSATPCLLLGPVDMAVLASLFDFGTRVLLAME